MYEPNKIDEPIGSSEVSPRPNPDPRIGGCETIPILKGVPLMGQTERADEITGAVIRQVMRTQQSLQDEARATTSALNTIAQKVTEISVRIEPVGLLQDRLIAQESRITKVEQAAVDAIAQAERQFRFVLAAMGIAGPGSVAIMMYLLAHFK